MTVSITYDEPDFIGQIALDDGSKEEMRFSLQQDRYDKLDRLATEICGLAPDMHDAALLALVYAFMADNKINYTDEERHLLTACVDEHKNETESAMYCALNGVLESIRPAVSASTGRSHTARLKPGQRTGFVGFGSFD